jgi:hypothetical protein
MGTPMTTTAQLAIALGDRYQIEREIGAGGMATVYLARDIKHDRMVALKVLRPDLAAVLGTERFLAEIRITAQLDHPHILTLIDSGAADGFLYYVLPYVRGESLRQKLDREKQLGVEETLAIAQAVGAALDYAHRQGVVHRDIKPENILFHEGEPMLTDFGIALAVREAAGSRLTETGISLGTPQYMSPEQATGDRQLDARSDVYSLGAVVYEMLAGEPPHTGPTVQAVIAKLLTERPTSLRLLRDALPEETDRAVAKALAQVPADRYSSAGAFVAALHAPATSRRNTVRGRRIALPALAGVVALALAVTAVIVLTRYSTAAPNRQYDRVRLTSTGHADNPIISPDGRQVAYLDMQCPDTGTCRTRIVVQDVATSAERIIADSVSGVELERWSPSGSWLRLLSYGSWRPVGEYVVPSLGGPLTYVTPGAFDFLPTGDTVLVAPEFDIRKRKATSLRLIALPSNQPLDSIMIAPPVGAVFLTYFVVAPNGRTISVVWQRVHGMMLSIYDRSGALRDTSSIPPGYEGLGWSAASNALFLPVFTTESRHAVLRIAVNATSGRFGARDTLLIAPGDENLGLFDLSASGHSLIYASRQVGEWTLATLERPTSTWPPRRVRRVQSSSVGIEGEISRDGRDIYYALLSTREGGGKSQLFVAPFDSGEPRAITPVLTGMTGKWEQTLDGRRVIVETAQGTGRGQLTAYDVTTGRGVPFGPTLPSGKYSPWEAGPDGIVLINPARDTLLVLDGSGHEQRRIGIPDSLGTIFQANPSPDATELAFLATRPDQPIAEDGSWEIRFYRVSLATGSIQQFNQVHILNVRAGNFRWTSDGVVHALLQPQGATRMMLYRVPLGGGPAVLEGEPPFAPDFCDCDMSSDGKRWIGIVAPSLSDLYLIRNFDANRR